VLSGDDDASKIDASDANLQTPDGDDVEGEGASSMEPIAPSLICPNAPVQTDPFAADRATLGAPSTGRPKWKRSRTVPKRKHSKTLIVQVMTQIELPPYRGPKSPLDLVAIEMIFSISLKLFNAHLMLLVLDHRLVVTPSLRRRSAHRC
jgi:hypothetical protein